MKLKERFKAAIPARNEILPFLGTFGAALAAKIPETAINAGLTYLIFEKCRKTPA